MNLEKPVVGQELYVVDIGNRARGGGHQRQGKVVKVGNKYFDVEFGDNYKSSVKFHINTRGQKTEYCQDYALYESKQGYEQALIKEKLYRKIAECFSGYNARQDLTLNDVMQIAEILDISVDD